MKAIVTRTDPVSVVWADDEPVVQFSPTIYSVSEASGTVDIGVSLDAAPSVTATIDVSSTDMTASGLLDYAPVSTTLEFPIGQTMVTLTVPITDDHQYGGDKTFSLTLSNPTAAILGDAETANVTITEADAAPAVTLEADAYTTPEAGGAVVVTVTLSGPSAFVTTVDLATADGTASHLSDYAAAAHSVTFGVGVTLITATIPITDDNLYEGNENFLVTLSSPVNATLGVTQTAAVAILDNESQPSVQLSASTYSVAENGGAAVVTVALSGPSAFVATVDLATSDRTASHLSDYIAVARTVTFEAGGTAVTVSIPITDNSVYQGERVLSVGLSNPLNATLGVISKADVTIVDNEIPPTLQLDSGTYSVAENNGPAVVTVTLSEASAVLITVDLATSDGTASHLTDYTMTTTKVTFAPGLTAMTTTIPITNDLLYEPSETFTVRLSNPVSATLGLTQMAAVTILDNDPQPAVAFETGAYSVAEAGGSAVVTVTLSGPSAFVTTVSLTTTDGTASRLTDYTATTSTVTFTPGLTAMATTIPITNDLVYELSETFTVGLSSPVGAGLGATQTAVVTILDNDPPPAVAFEASSFSVLENGGAAVVTVTLSGPSAFVTTVSLTTTAGTASGLSDYTPISRTLTFSSSVTTVTTTVPITDDLIYERNETFTVGLSNPVSATLGVTSTAAITIVDNDPEPTVQLSAGTYSVAEAGGAAVVTVTLSGPSAFVTTVSLTTADGTASAATDFTPVSRTVSFLAGTQSVTATITITDDLIYERNETFPVGLSSPVSATLGVTSTAAVTIVDNDPEPTVQLSAGTYSVTEDRGPAVVTVTLSGASAFVTTVSLTTTNGTASAASDFAPVSRTLSFLAGTQSVTATITITDDILYERNETFTVGLSRPVSATVGLTATAVVTILDNETQPTLAFETPTYSVVENGGAGVVTVTLNHPSVFTITVAFSTTAGTAEPGVNYLDVSGTLVFTPGIVSRAFFVPVFYYPFAQPSKSVNLTLSNPTSSTITGTIPAILWILDFDGPPGVRFGAAAYTAQEGIGAKLIQVQLTHPSELTITVAVTSTDGTALSGRDYVPVSTTLTIPGQQSLTGVDLPVVITDDAWYEGDRYLWLTLGSPTNAELAPYNTLAKLTIQENDPPPTVQFDRSAYSVSEAGIQTTITVMLDRPSIFTTTVRYDTSNGSAVAGSDYLTATGTLTFSPGSLQQTFLVTILNDAVFKGERSVNLTLSQPTAQAILGRATAALIIVDNDPPPAVQFSASEYRVNETSGPALLTVTLSLSVPVMVPVTVTVATFDGTADTHDYVPYTGTLSFSPGVTQTVFPLTIVNDGQLETITKTVRVTVTPAQNAVQGQPASAILVITDNNAPAPSCTGCLSVASLNVPQAIPDAVGAVPGIITSTLVITPPNLTVNNLVVRVGELLHTYSSDVRLSLVAPNGQTVELVADPGVYQDQQIGFIGMIFDDRALIDLNAPNLPPLLTGRFRPDSPLGVLKGTPATGVWKLIVMDVDPRGPDVGTLYAWSIEFQTGYNKVYLPLVFR
jgi:subtilisin-like proprotein convertase family protein